MAKNDWNAGDFINRTAANQPFWLSSGTVGGTGDGANDLRTFISPGSIRYPWKADLVVSGQTQSHIVSAAQAAKFYSYFIRSNGTVMVSGTSTRTIPSPPRYDAEYIGTVYTGDALGDASMTGPWNQGAYGGYEQRGQMVASRQPRIVQQEYINSYTTYNGHVASETASGIGWLSLQDASPPQATYLSATIHWIASGSIPASGRLECVPEFYIWPMKKALFHASDFRTFTNTDAIGVGGWESVATHISAVAPSGSFAGYRLYADMGWQSSTTACAIFVRGIEFTAITGLYNSGALTQTGGSSHEKP